jgi:hypothetical protein
MSQFASDEERCERFSGLPKQIRIVNRIPKQAHFSPPLLLLTLELLACLAGYGCRL